MLRKITFTLVALLLAIGSQLMGAQLPLHGGYYRIKNAHSGTYIGGTGTGNDAVKHVAAETDPDYQVFLVVRNPVNGFTSFKQVARNSFVTHNNSWTGSFATAVTGSYRQSFFIDVTTNPDFCIIQKIRDDGSKANGIGYDSDVPGSSLFMDKGTDKQNKWLFEPVISQFSDRLQTLIDQANALNSTALADAVAIASEKLSSSSDVEIDQAMQELKKAILDYKTTSFISTPVDITDLVVLNADFEWNVGRNMPGWNAVTSWSTKPDMVGAMTGFAAEAWRSSTSAKVARTVSQRIAGLPNGKYNVSIAAFATDQRAGEQVLESSVEVFAGDKAASVSIQTPFVNDSTTIANATVYTITDAVVVDNTLVIGLRDNSSNANWIGFDNVKVFFNGTVDLTEVFAELTAVYTPIKEFYDAIADEVAGENDGDVAGKYRYSDFVTLGIALSDAQAILSATPYTGTIESIGAAKAALQSARLAMVKYTAINTLPEGEYFVKLGTYYLNNPGMGAVANGVVLSVANGGLQTERTITDAGQIYSLSLVEGVGRYSFYSRLNETDVYRHLTENAVYQPTWGSSDNNWRTMNIHFDGYKYAVQTAGSASAKGFWCLKTDSELSTNASTSLDVNRDFVFEFLSVPSVFAAEVAVGRALLDAAVRGNGSGEYLAAIYDAFQSAVETAEAIVLAGSAQTADLMAYAAAKVAFVPNTISSSYALFIKGLQVTTSRQTLSLIAETAIPVAVYSVNGTRLSEFVVSGSKSLTLPAGVYILKANEGVQRFVIY